MHNCSLTFGLIWAPTVPFYCKCRCCIILYFHNNTLLCICISRSSWAHPVPSWGASSIYCGKNKDFCFRDETTVWETNPGGKTSGHTYTCQWWLVCATRCCPQRVRYFSHLFVFVVHKKTALTWSLFLGSIKRFCSLSKGYAEFS